MVSVKKRAAWGWAAGLVVLGALFALSSAARPTVPDASAAIVGRSGLLLLVAALPVVLAARAISRFNRDNVIAAFLLPVLLAACLAVLVHFFGFLPEDARMCTALQRYNTIDIGPECFTPIETRLAMLAEAYGVWLVFGAALWGAFKLTDRSERRRLEKVRGS